MRSTEVVVRAAARRACLSALLLAALAVALPAQDRPVPPAANPVAQPSGAASSGAASSAAPATSSRFVVVIDAAHGGDDNGGRLNTGHLEKSATLALSVRLRSLLTARGIQVVTTREGDNSLTPDQRAAVANRAKAEACISLHVAETGSGVHLFASNLAPTQPQRFAPWKTAQSSYMTRSLAFVGDLNEAFLHANVPVTLGRVTLPGVDSMTCPAVAVELAPERDADRKTVAEPDNADYQARTAALIAAAIVQWRAEAHQP